MYQKLIFIGNLGSNPEMRFTPAGDPVTTFSVATSRKAGEKDETTWFRVSETQTRIMALRSAKLVGKLPEHWDEPECEQQLLFDLPEPKKTYQWEW